MRVRSFLFGVLLKIALRSFAAGSLVCSTFIVEIVYRSSEKSFFRGRGGKERSLSVNICSNE